MMDIKLEKICIAFMLFIIIVIWGRTDIIIRVLSMSNLVDTMCM